jgi:hypothetical protein
METNTASLSPAAPLALDPLGPIAPRPRRLEDRLRPADPLGIDPLDPIPLWPDEHSATPPALGGLPGKDADRVWVLTDAHGGRGHEPSATTAR